MNQEPLQAATDGALLPRTPGKTPPQLRAEQISRMLQSIAAALPDIVFCNNPNDDNCRRQAAFAITPDEPCECPDPPEPGRIRVDERTLQALRRVEATLQQLVHSVTSGSQLVIRASASYTPSPG